MVYGRFGGEITHLRLAMEEDIRRIDKHEPDTDDKEAIERGSYVVATYDDGFVQVVHLAYLRADNGAVEIQELLAKG